MLTPPTGSARHLALLLVLGVAPCWAEIDSPSNAEPPSGEVVPSDAELESSGAVIGEILIDNQNIFNPAYPGENVRLFRLANRLHIKTKAGVVRHQLLFQSGDRYSRRVLDETERILRAERYFYDAWIKPVRYHDGKVDLRVTTRDVWTLNPGFDFGRSGGKNTTGVDLEELNLLGTGVAIALTHKAGVDRDETRLEISDEHAFGSWTGVDATYADNSDGYRRQLVINRPFYSLNTRYAGGFTGTDDLRVDSLYDRGEIVDQFRDHSRYVEGYGGWSSGLANGWVRRWTAGATYDERLFDPTPTWTGLTLLPQGRKFIYPWVRFDLIKDDYLKMRNRDQIGRTEDFYLGATASVRVGWADSALGSSRSGLQFQTSAGYGVAASERSTVLLSATYTGRVESGEIRYYAEQSSHWLFFTTLVGAAGQRLDLENQLLLGGTNGLRGYPLRYQGGDARGLLTIEQRYFSDWYPFRLFRVGAAAFFDAGRTWGSAPLATPSLGLLKDAGFGLRIGNSRSGLGNVVHVDLAFPFDGDSGIKRVQFLIQTEQSF